MTSTAQWKLRRLAPRAIEVYELHKNREPAIEMFGPTLLPAAQALIASYDAVEAYGGTRAREHKEGKSAVAVVQAKLRGWTSIVAGTFEGVDTQAYGTRPDVPEDVIREAGALIRFVEEQAGENPPPFLETMKADMEPAIEAATREWKEATTAGSTHADLLAATRDAARAFHRQLVMFRRTLSVHIGRSHPDFQRLRVARVRGTPNDDLEELAELEHELQAETPTPTPEPTAPANDEEAAE